MGRLGNLSDFSWVLTAVQQPLYLSLVGSRIVWTTAIPNFQHSLKLSSPLYPFIMLQITQPIVSERKIKKEVIRC